DIGFGLKAAQPGQVSEARYEADGISRDQHAVEHLVRARDLTADEESPGLHRPIAESQQAQRNSELRRPPTAALGNGRLPDSIPLVAVLIVLKPQAVLQHAGSVDGESKCFEMIVI